MNPNLYNPDPRQDIPAVRRINDSTPRISDNVQIVDHGKAANDWKDSGAYNKDVDGQFKYTDKNWQEGFNEAARSGKPVVVVFGSEKTSHTKSLIDGPTKGSRDGGNDAVYIFVDKNRVDKSTELGQYAEKNVGNDPDMAYTGIFALTPDQDGQPHLGKLVANTWGARGEISSVIKDQLQYAQRRMDQNKGKFKVPDAVEPETKKNDGDAPEEKPEVKDKPEQNDKPKSPELTALEHLNQQREDIFGSIVAGRNENVGADSDYREAVERMLKFKIGEGEHVGLTKDQRQQLFDKAVETSDQVDPKETAMVKQFLDRELEEERKKGDGADKSKVDNLTNYRATIDHMDIADGITRFERGLFHLNEGDLEDGVKDIKDAFERHPELAKQPSYIDRMAKTIYAGDELDKAFPDLKLKERQQELEKEKAETPEKTPENTPEKQPEKQPEKEPEKTPEKEPEKVEVKEPAVKDSDEDLASIEHLKEAQGRIKEALGKIQGANTYEARLAVYDSAIAAADAVDQGDLSRVTALFQKSLAEEQAKSDADPNTISGIKNNIEGLGRLGAADGYLRVNKGLFEMSQGQDPDSADRGMQSIAEGARRHPELMENAEIAGPVVEMAKAKGVSADRLRELLPYKGVSQMMEKAAYPEVAKEPESPSDHKVEKTPEKTRFEKIDSLAKLNEAIEAAHESGRPLIMDFRADWCGPCQMAEKAAWNTEPVQKAIDKNAIFAQIDLTNSPEELEPIASEMKVKSLPANVMVRTYEKPDGSIGLKEVARTGEEFGRGIAVIGEARKLLAQAKISANQALVDKAEHELADLVIRFIEDGAR
ncbi:MAG: thioredoxin family protein [Cyanobacteriota/Melainabacteria group bacterium]